MVSRSCELETKGCSSSSGKGGPSARKEDSNGFQGREGRAGGPGSPSTPPSASSSAGKGPWSLPVLLQPL